MFDSPTRRANRRKLFVFATTFLLLAAAGLLYSYSRPAVYLANARVQINPGALQVEAAVSTGGTQGANATRSLLNELQVLTSRPLVKQVLDKVPTLGDTTNAKLGADPVAELQAGLEAVVAQGTDVVELSSRGADPERAATLVNELIVAYTQKLADGYAQTAGSSLTLLGDEVAQLTDKVKTQRRQMEDFRVRHGIVSFEREENEVLGRVKGQTEALNKAQEKLAVAEGKLRAMSESASAGRPTAAPVRPNATLENLEQRASAAREELAELNRAYTAEYLAMDPRARAVRNRLAELERQVTTQRQSTVQVVKVDQSSALADAREEVNAARDTVARIAQQASGNRGALQQFAARFSEFKTLKEELAPLESLLRDATQRKARMEAGEAARRPSVRVLEPAFAPREAWQPQYTRDAAIVLAAAFLLALLAMWLVELFNRVDAPPTMLVAQGRSTYPRYAGDPGLELGFDAEPGNAPRLARPMPLAVGHALQDSPAPPTLRTPTAPRELLQDELTGILRNASPNVALFVHMLLRGISPQEAIALRGHNVDTEAKLLRIGSTNGFAHASPHGEDGLREVPLDAGFHQLILSGFKVTPAVDGQTLLSNGNGGPLGLPNLAAELLYAAHDAGIDQPSEVTPDTLRHTAAAFLARQGIRLTDMAKVMGDMGAEQAALYSAMAPSGKRLGIDEVQRLMPAVTNFA
jgi:polysaccharide biosynthesis transport protein